MADRRIDTQTQGQTDEQTGGQRVRLVASTAPRAMRTTHGSSYRHAKYDKCCSLPRTLELPKLPVSSWQSHKNKTGERAGDLADT